MKEELFKKAKEIREKYGVCPSLNNVVVQIAALTPPQGASPAERRKNFFKAFDAAIKEVGYSKSYYNAQMRAIGTEL